MGVNTIGLGVLDRIKYLYDYFGIEERCIDVTEDFSQKLLDALSTPFPHESVLISLARRKEESIATYTEAISTITS